MISAYMENRLRNKIVQKLIPYIFIKNLLKSYNQNIVKIKKKTHSMWHLCMSSKSYFKEFYTTLYKL